MSSQDDVLFLSQCTAVVNHYVAACVICAGLAANAALLLFLLCRKLCASRAFAKFNVAFVLLLVDNITILLVFLAEQIVPYFAFLHPLLPLNSFVRHLAVVYAPVLEVLYSYDSCLTTLLVIERWSAMSRYVMLRKLLSRWRFGVALVSGLTVSMLWHISTYYANRSMGDVWRYAGIFSVSDSESSSGKYAFYYATLTASFCVFQLLPFAVMLVLLRKAKQTSALVPESDASTPTHYGARRDETRDLPFLVTSMTAYCFCLDLLAHCARLALEYYRLSISFQSDRYYSFGVSITNLSIVLASSLHLIVYLRAYCAQPLESLGYFKSDSDENFEIALAHSTVLRSDFVRISAV